MKDDTLQLLNKQLMKLHPQIPKLEIETLRIINRSQNQFGSIILTKNHKNLLAHHYFIVGQFNEEIKKFKKEQKSKSRVDQ